MTSPELPGPDPPRIEWASPIVLRLGPTLEPRWEPPTLPALAAQLRDGASEASERAAAELFAFARESLLGEADEILLLRAATLDGQAAQAAWRQLAELDLDQLPPLLLRVVPALYPRLLDWGVSGEPLRAAKRRYREAWLGNRRLIGAASAALALLAAGDVEALLIKGAALLPRYRDSGRRALADVDLAIRPADRERAAAILERDGWRPTARADSATRRAFFKAGVGEVDLHHQLLPWPSTPALEEAEMWQTAVALDLEGLPVRGLDPTAQLLHLGVSGGKGSPQWLADSMTLLTVEGERVDWPRLLRMIQRLRQTTPLRLALERIARYAPELRAPILDPLRRGQPSWGPRLARAQRRQHGPGARWLLELAGRAIDSDQQRARCRQVIGGPARLLGERARSGAAVARLLGVLGDAREHLKEAQATASARPAWWPSRLQRELLQLVHGPRAEARDRWRAIAARLSELGADAPRLLPAVQQALDERLPGPGGQALRAAYLGTWLANRRLLPRAARVIGLLQRQGIPLLALRGLAHSAWIPDDTRAINNIDLLVPPSRQAEAAELLVGSGWSLDPQPTRCGLDRAPLVLRSDGVEVKLHEGLSPRLEPRQLPDDDRDPLWKLATPVELGVARTLTPSAAHMLLGVIANGARLGSRAPLRWISDAAFVARAMTAPDWEMLLREARRLRATIRTAVALRCLGACSSLAIPDAVQRGLAVSHPSWPERLLWALDAAPLSPPLTGAIHRALAEVWAPQRATDG